MEEIKVSEMLQADSINKDDSVMIIQEGVNKKTSGSIQTATGTSLTLPSVADTCKVKSNSKNLFDKNKITDGYRLSSTGELISGTGYCVSEYIPVKPNTTYVSNLAITTNNCVCYFATPTEGSGTRNIDTNPFTTPSDCNYIRVSRGTDAIDGFQIEEGDTSTEYNPYNTNIIVRTKNLIANIIKGYALSGNTGEIAVNPQRAVSDFIKVEGGETYTRSGYTTSGLVWYKADKTRISNDNSNPVTAPANAVYVRLGINTTADYSKAQFEKGTTATTYVKGENQEILLTPQEEKGAFTYDTETNILSDGSVAITYSTKGRLLSNEDASIIKEYIDDIVEEGTNENGDYIKYRNGLMICRKTVTVTGAVTTASGSMYISGDLSLGDWPVPFTQKPVYSVNQNGGTSAASINYLSSASATSAGNVRLMRPTSNASVTWIAGIIAIGRWK